MGDFFSNLQSKHDNNNNNNNNNHSNKNHDDDAKNESQSLEKKADSMQLVADKIYMGSDVAAQNLTLLRQNQITHVLAIGWNLKKHYEGSFEYLLVNKVEDRPGFIILPKFAECFVFIDAALSTAEGRLFVHCHKGLSRSATIIIAYEMYTKKLSFEAVLDTIRKSRSFIMPNIGFQSQLRLFAEKNYSIAMADYTSLDLDILGKISIAIPKMKAQIAQYYELFAAEQYDDIDDQELFQLTMYIHQVHLLYKNKKLSETDIRLLHESIQILRDIQVEFVDDKASLLRFEKMFHLDKTFTAQPPLQQK